MKLADYVDAVRGRQAELARVLKCPPPLIFQWARSVRPVPYMRCLQLEHATGGHVTCEEMRPDIAWCRVRDRKWPHPQGRPFVEVSANVKSRARA